MQNNKHVTEELELVGSLKDISQVYEEISVMRMQKNRSVVLKARAFTDSLSEVFADVKTSYRQQILEILKKNSRNKDVKTASFFRKNGKTLTVLLSVSAKLYGGIVRQTFETFITDLAEKDTDIMIVGKLGKEMFDNSSIKKQYIYIDIPNAEVTDDAYKAALYHLLQYDEVNIYYPQFESIINQKPISFNLSGDSQLTVPLEQNSNEEETKFLFEPSLEKILHFFESQIFSTVFKQVSYESQLAHFASRIRAMDEALDRIERKEKDLNVLSSVLRKRRENKKQIEMVSRRGLWR